MGIYFHFTLNGEIRCIVIKTLSPYSRTVCRSVYQSFNLLLLFVTDLLAYKVTMMLMLLMTTMMMPMLTMSTDSSLNT